MNGVKSKVEIFKPFGQAVELANKILFQPFDVKKWLVIGFAAFLSGHFAGVGFNLPSPFGNFQSHRATQDLIPAHFEQWDPWFVAILVVLGLLFLAFVIVLMWLKARGNFIFTDCIVRNRAAIGEPWGEFRKEGNSYFLFLLAFMFAMLLFAGLIFAIFFGLGWLKQDAFETGSIASITLIALLFVFGGLVVIFFSIVAYLMAPVMYRKRCRAVQAFRDVILLMMHNAGSFFLFCLFGIVLILAALMIGGIVTCATCCLAALPYVGTVVLLPVFVCLRAFTLAFLRQFGLDYDVWVSFMPPEFVPILSGMSPRPPSTASGTNPPSEPPSHSAA